jgi:hypothetical protein
MIVVGMPPETHGGDTATAGEQCRLLEIEPR